MKQEKQKIYVNNVGFTMVMVEGNDEISDYQIGETPVTQELWQAVMGSNPSYFSGCPQCPVEQVSWNDAQAFIEKLNRLTEQNFRIPTEVEWLYAAKGGNKSKGYEYAGSNNVDEVAWYSFNSDAKTHPVGQRKPNELGLYDMSGNVYEWSEGDNILEIHGGSWYSRLDNYCVANRFDIFTHSTSNILGFRLAI